mgnify:CR=1 FL=1
MRTSAAYDRLANMGQRLLEVIRHNRGGANKDLAKICQPDRCAVRQMGSITLTKAKGIWQMLLAPLRGAATLLAVLVLAALLTTVRHNASAYLTGVWDTGSQTLVYGRIHQMEQGQHAPGGFLGVYTDDWSDDTNRALFRDDNPHRRGGVPNPLHPPVGLAGLAVRQGQPSAAAPAARRSGARDRPLLAEQHAVLRGGAACGAGRVGKNSARWWQRSGLRRCCWAPWLQRGMKDLYWCLWTWLLPLLATLWLCHCTRVRGKTPRGCWPLVAAACMVRCMCGFEFITTLFDPV